MIDFPIIKQLDSMYCGPTNLQMVAKFYGEPYSLQTLHSKAFLPLSGVSKLGFSETFEHLGFRTQGNQFTRDQNSDESLLPSIVHQVIKDGEVLATVMSKRDGREIFQCPEPCTLCHHFLPGPFFKRKEVRCQR